MDCHVALLLSMNMLYFAVFSLGALFCKVFWDCWDIWVVKVT
jgi:hypothetical protein